MKNIEEVRVVGRAEMVASREQEAATEIQKQECKYIKSFTKQLTFN